jgi:DNA polymerase-3 subunit delta'
VGFTEANVGGVWGELLGQDEAVAQLQQAVANREQGVHHAWLLTGPPGSGRSNLAHAFARALVCEQGGCGTCHSCQLAIKGTHPDITVLATDKVIIGIDEVRNLVSQSQFGGTMSRYRIMIIEDADRMAERSSNVLLKALEEPPVGTIWLLCAPSEADMLPTIRSRVRRVGLKVPSVAQVAKLLVERDGIDPKIAQQVAAESQSHIGMARRLATSNDARSRRRESLLAALHITTVTSAVNASAQWLEVAKKDADALTEERDAAERRDLLATLGVQEGDNVPPNLRTDIKNLEESQKRRAQRSLRDGIDRILVDLLALYRDVLSIQLATNSPLVNEDLRVGITDVAKRSTATATIAKLDAIQLCRHRLTTNARDIVALDALAVSLRTAK